MTKIDILRLELMLSGLLGPEWVFKGFIGLGLE